MPDTKLIALPTAAGPRVGLTGPDTRVVFEAYDNDGPGDPDPRILTVIEEATVSFSSPPEGNTVGYGVTMTVTPPRYALDGVEDTTGEVLVVDRSWLSNESGNFLAFESPDGSLVYITQEADEGVTFDWFEVVLNPDTGLALDPAEKLGNWYVSDTPQITQQAPLTAADWSVTESVYVPSNQTTDFKPIVQIDLGLTVHSLQWTTSGSVPALDSHWETMTPTGNANEFTTDMLNQGTGDWDLFQSGKSRNSQFRLRWKAAASDIWSFEGNTVTLPEPDERELPGTVAFAVTPGAGPGQITITVGANQPSTWGDGLVGRWWWRAGNEAYQELGYKLAGEAFSKTLSSGFYGQLTPISIIARDLSGFDGPETIHDVNVPGTPTGDETGWNQLVFTSPNAVANPSLYRLGKSGVQLQHIHGGDASPVNPDKVILIEDVSWGWLTKNAGDNWPFWEHIKGEGVRNRYSVAVKWDPEDENRFLYVVSKAGNNTALGPGIKADGKPGNTDGGWIYETLNNGESFNPVLTLSNWCPGGSNSAYGGMYRAFRPVLTYDPQNFNQWYYMNDKDGFYSSTNRGRSGSWSKKWNFPYTHAMKRTWCVVVSPNNSQYIFVGAESGLWKSSDKGSGFSNIESGTGLPSGPVTSIWINPNNANEILIVKYGKGLYRSTNGGTSFTKRNTNRNNICQIAVSPVDDNHQWCVAVNQPFGNGGGGNAIYSSNRGVSWNDITTDATTYGWLYQQGNGSPNWQSFLRVPGKVDRHEQQGVIIPNGSVATKAVGNGGAIFWGTTNGINWKNKSDGFESLASGESNMGNIAWNPQNLDESIWGVFDYGWYRSLNDMESYENMQAGPGGIDDHVKANYMASWNPENQNYIIGNYGGYMRPVTVIRSTNKGVSWSRPAHFASNADNGGGIKQNWVSYDPIVGKYAYSQTSFSDDYGATWTYWASREEGNTFANNCHSLSRNNDSGVFGVSPVDGRYLYAFNASHDKIYRTTNRGVTWSFYTNCGGLPSSRKQPYSFWMDLEDPDVIYWWSNGNGLRRFDGSNLATSATEISDSGMNRVRQNPLNPSEFYLFSGLSSGSPNCYLSTGGFGGTFKDITENLPLAGSQRSIEIHPKHGFPIVVGTAGTRGRDSVAGSPRYQELVHLLKD